MAINNGDISVSANFQLNINKPLDARTVVSDISDLPNITFKYLGMLVYISNIDKYYSYNGTIWTELNAGGSSGDYVDLTTNQTIDGTKSFLDDISINGVTFGTRGDVSSVSIGRDTLGVLQASNSYNTAIGSESLFSTILGYYNTALGGNSLYSNINGWGNSALGFNSLYSNTLAGYNTAIGFESLYYNTEGIGNTGVGYRALFGNVNTNYNTAIGYNSGVDVVPVENATAIGANAIVSLSNAIQLGDENITYVITSGKLSLGDITYPNIDGTVGQVLATDGNGILGWIDNGSGGMRLADNGLTLNSNTIELGGTLNKITDIDISANNLTVSKTGIVLFDISNAFLTDIYGTLSMSFGNRTLHNENTDIVVNYNSCTLSKTEFDISLDWYNRNLYTSLGEQSVDWGNRLLLSNSGSLDWDACALNTTSDGGTTTLNWNYSELKGATGISLNWKERKLYPVGSGGFSGHMLSWDGANVRTPLAPVEDDDIVNKLYVDGFIKKDGTTLTTEIIPFELGINSKTDSIINEMTVGKGKNNIQSNTAVGNFSLFLNSTGQSNTTLGFHTMVLNTTGSENVAVGTNSLFLNDTGILNVSVGANSMDNNTNGSNNVGIGGYSLRNNTTGNNNIAIGLNSLLGNVDGSFNVRVGHNTTVTTTNLTNSIAIGANSVLDESNAIQLGDTNITKVKTSGKLVSGTITYPNTDGTVNQVLATNGSGVLGWIDSGSNLNIHKTIFVDISNGNDLTALKYNTSKRYYTIKKALQDAVAGDTVYVFPGLYDEYQLPPLDGVTLYLSDGVTIQPTFNGGNVAIISEHNAIGGRDGAPMNFKIKGRGKLMNNGNAGADTTSIVISRGSTWEVELESLDRFEIWRNGGHIIFKNTKLTKEVHLYNRTSQSATFIDCEFQNCQINSTNGSYQVDYAIFTFKRCTFVRTLSVYPTAGTATVFDTVTLLANSFFPDTQNTNNWEFSDCIFINMIGGDCLSIVVPGGFTNLTIINCVFHTYDYVNGIQGTGSAFRLKPNPYTALEVSTNITYFLNDIYSNANYIEESPFVITNSYTGSNWFTYNTQLYSHIAKKYISKLNIANW